MLILRSTPYVFAPADRIPAAMSGYDTIAQLGVCVSGAPNATKADRRVQPGQLYKHGGVHAPS